MLTADELDWIEACVEASKGNPELLGCMTLGHDSILALVEMARRAMPSTHLGQPETVDAQLAHERIRCEALESQIQKMALDHLASEGQWIEMTGKLREQLAEMTADRDSWDMEREMLENDLREAAELRADAARFAHVLACEFWSARHYDKQITEAEFKARRRAQYDSAIQADKEA